MINSARRSDPPLADGLARLRIAPPPAPADPMCSSINLQATAGEVAEARRFVASFVDDPTLVGDAVLCVSELATNAIMHSNSRHPDGRFIVAAERYIDGRFRIKVLDQGGPWVEQTSTGYEHFGLMIVSRLADVWGTYTDGRWVRAVWFELPPAEASAMSVA